jgi:hypothetical protein
MTLGDYIEASEDERELRRALAQDPDKLAAALMIVARAKRLDPDRLMSQDGEEERQ